MFSCDEEQVYPVGLDQNLTGIEWTRSLEEEADPNAMPQIYRPEDYADFTATRFRQTFQFNTDKSCEYKVLAPNDAHYTTTGSWAMDTSRVLTIFDESENQIFEFEIVRLTDNKLVLQ